jgi:hypothetical protein
MLEVPVELLERIGIVSDVRHQHGDEGDILASLEMIDTDLARLYLARRAEHNKPHKFDGEVLSYQVHDHPLTEQEVLERYQGLDTDARPAEGER